jgi:hypothetical protein
LGAGKWFGALACGLLVMVLLLSGQYRLHLTTRWAYNLEVMTGAMTFQWLDRDARGARTEPVVRVRTTRRPDPYDLTGLLRGPRYWPPGIRRVQSGSDVTDVWYLDGYCSLPGWMILLVGAAPTGWLWWRDHRRIPPGDCRKCGYNLTGNASGRCPECGEAVPRGRAADDVADSRT